LLQCCTTTKPTQQPPTSADNHETLSAKEMFLESNEDVGSKGLSVVQQNNEPSADKRKPDHGPITKYQGLSYWIERIGHDKFQRVTSSTIFHDGDRIRFHLRSNRSGYLYVVAQGTSGRSLYLFPTKTGESEYIEANRNYDIPSQGSITFDTHPGTEVIWLFLSKQPLPVSGLAQSGNVSSNPIALNSCGSKDLLIASPESIQTQCGPKNGGQAKDILIQDDTSAADPAGYAVMSKDQLDQGAMLSLKLELRHE
jgi:hypothetical protein